MLKGATVPKVRTRSSTSDALSIPRSSYNTKTFEAAKRRSLSVPETRERSRAPVQSPPAKNESQEVDFTRVESGSQSDSVADQSNSSEVCEEAILGSCIGDLHNTVDEDTSDEDGAETSSLGQEATLETLSCGDADRVDSAAAAYISALTQSSGLHIVEEAGVRGAYRDHGELGLFGLFLTSLLADFRDGQTKG